MRTPPYAPETRERILEAAAAMVARRRRLSMEALACEAGVSRQTIYLHFRDRAGLISQLLPYLSGPDVTPQDLHALVDLPARQAFDCYFRAWIRIACRVGPYLRPLYATLGEDRDVTASVSAGDAVLTGFYVRIFARLEEAGLLHPRWTAAEAADAAWSMTLYMLTVDHMRLMRGWSDDQIEAIQMKLLESAFLKDSVD